MTTDLVLLGTAGAPLPVAGRCGISAALAVDGRVFVVDCGRGTPSAFADAGLDFRRLEAVFLTHLHADHTGDLLGLLLYPWGVRTSEDGAVPPVRVYRPPSPATVPKGDADFHCVTTIHPERPVPGPADLVQAILAGYARRHGDARPRGPGAGLPVDTADGSVVFSGDHGEPGPDRPGPAG